MFTTRTTAPPGRGTPIVKLAHDFGKVAPAATRALSPAKPELELGANTTAAASSPPTEMPRLQNLEIRRVPVADIVVVGNRRPCDENKVRSLADSIAAIGLRTPITVMAGNPTPGSEAGHTPLALVVGLHRVEAVRSLGWTDLQAFVMAGDEVDARLWTLAENLHRAELTALQRAEQLAEWVRLTEAKVSGQLVRKPQGGRPEGGVAQAARALPVPGKSEEAKRKSIERAIMIDSITTEAKDEARRAGLDNNQSALIAIADEAPNNQVAKADKLATRKRKRRRRRIAAAAGAEAADVDVIGAPGASQTASAPPRDVLTFAAILERWRATKVTASDEAAFARFKAAWQPACAAVPDLQAACTDAPESVRVRILAEVWGWRIDDQQAAAPQGPATASDQPTSTGRDPHHC